ncbi:hypothetical protein [Pseudomonas fluorescens]|uniref:Uncharacterized protein n=1 Tax=Pseudomonas fluorescens TaxID=294 RepID=A0A5E7IPL0_PSEFL|nr:hypothetical protein [Pseudomonas fluorescens]VVO76707.1 hypothetical protein PS854_01583 [Pseudomonas fluorescens]
MRHLSSLKLVRAVPDPDDKHDYFIVYSIFGCAQAKDVSLKDLPQPAMQSFAVIHPQCVDDEVFQILEAARNVGALSPVKLMDVRGDSLYLFLDTKVSSTTFAAIESLWMTVLGTSDHGRMTVHFANEIEVFSGHSDYPYWCGAKEILETEKLGLAQDVLPGIAVSIAENDRPEVTELPTLRTLRGGIISLAYSRLLKTHIPIWSELWDLTMTTKKNKKNPSPCSLRPVENNLAWISQCTTSELPCSLTAEYCAKRTFSGKANWAMLQPQEKRRAKGTPHGKAFGGVIEVAITRAELAWRKAKLLQEFLKRH